MSLKLNLQAFYLFYARISLFHAFSTRLSAMLLSLIYWAIVVCKNFHTRIRGSSLKNCNRIAEILLNRALRGKDQRWCSNLKCTNAPPVHQTLHYNHQTWSPVETLGSKIGAGKVLWDSNNCTSRYSNCSYNQTRKPKLHSESIDWRTWSVAQSERQSTPVEARQWAGGQKVNENYWDQKGTTETSWELLRRLEENGGGDRLLITM